MNERRFHATFFRTLYDTDSFKKLELAATQFSIHSDTITVISVNAWNDLEKRDSFKMKEIPSDWKSISDQIMAKWRIDDTVSLQIAFGIFTKKMMYTWSPCDENQWGSYGDRRWTLIRFIWVTGTLGIIFILVIFSDPWKSAGFNNGFNKMEYSDSFCLFETQFFHFEILLVIYCERHISLRSILMCETLSKQWRKVCLRSNCFSKHGIQLKSPQQLYTMGIGGTRSIFRKMSFKHLH